MTDFNTQVNESPVDQVSPGVADPAGNSGVGAALAQGVAGIATIFANERAYANRSSGSSATQLNNKVVASYLEKQQQLADMVEQDPSRLSEAQSLSRVFFREYSASNEGAAVALAAAHRQYVEPSGLGPIVADVGKLERAQEKKLQEATDKGAVNPYAPPEVREQQLQGYLKTQEQTQYLNSGRVNDQIEARQVMTQIAKGSVQEYATSYQAIADNPNLTTEQKVAGIMRQSNLHLASIESLGVGAEDRPMQDAAIAAVTRYRQLQVDSLNGKFETESINAQLDNLQATLTLGFASSSPMAQKALITSGLGFKDPTMLQNKLMTDLNNYMAGNIIGRPTFADIASEDNSELLAASKKYVISPSIAEWRAGNLSPEGKVSLDKTLNSMLRDVSTYAMSREDPKSNARAMEFFSDPALGEYMAASGPELNELRNRTAEVLGGTYRSQLLKILEQEVDSKSDIKLVWKGGTARFEGEDTLFGMVGFRKDASDLNKSSSKLLTQYVKASAHLEGTTDYQKWFNDNMIAFVPNQARAEQQEANANGTGKPVRGQVVSIDEGDYVYIGGPDSDPNDPDNWAEAR